MNETFTSGLPELLTRKEVAHAARVSLNTIHRWQQSGVLAAQRVGPRLTRFRREDVERLVQPAIPSAR